MVGFLLAGQRFQALNGGPHFNFTEAISLVVDCDSQEREACTPLPIPGV
ncbi:VOC family protein [Archangium violaceum]|nr:VOC family protein [Archangium violaceum]